MSSTSVFSMTFLFECENITITKFWKKFFSSTSIKDPIMFLFWKFYLEKTKSSNSPYLWWVKAFFSKGVSSTPTIRKHPATSRWKFVGIISKQRNRSKWKIKTLKARTFLSILPTKEISKFCANKISSNRKIPSN